MITLRVRGSTAPFAHDDGASGETPLAQAIAIRSLTLFRTAGDPSPVQVYDLGAAAVECGLGDGADTFVTKVPLASLPAGTFTVARVGVSHVRYKVAATMHTSGISVAGAYDNVQALSEGAIVDGQARAKGWYRFAFTANGTEYGAITGAGILPTSSGPTFTLDTSGSVAAYVFPIVLAIDPTGKKDLTVAFEANTFEDFRWKDEAGETSAGYAPGVFDTTPTSYESVTSFGANGFRLIVQ